MIRGGDEERGSMHGTTWIEILPPFPIFGATAAALQTSPLQEDRRRARPSHAAKKENRVFIDIILPRRWLNLAARKALNLAGFAATGGRLCRQSSASFFQEGLTGSAWGDWPLFAGLTSRAY